MTPPSAAPQALTLSELTSRIGQAIALARGVNDVWVVGESSDLRVSRGHCYLDLIEKDASGVQLAKMRAMIWQRDYLRLAPAFENATGTPLRSDLKLMVRVRTSFHPLFGLSLTITDINPEFTAGDMLRRRREILDRLKAEGVLELNRSLPWPRPVLRIAIISSAGAAGYGDFIRQLYSSPSKIRFRTRLFEAPMQGAMTSPGIIAALDRIAAEADDFDIVVIIRGGGAVADLTSFDDYALAANVAQFPLPVIVGIGHERDQCVLDFVASRSARTPTAAAEYLVDLAEGELRHLLDLASAISRSATDHTRAEHQRLSRIEGELPILARGIITRHALRLDAAKAMLEALSPEATLRRGFSITRLDGAAITDASRVNPGSRITTVLADGILESTVTSSNS